MPCHKDHDAMPQLGIFWVYLGQVFGRARALADGDESRPGLLDSPDDHVSLWENAELRKPARLHSEYFDVPRGRVVFSTEEHRAIIYLDASLSGTAVRKRILSFFDLGGHTGHVEGGPALHDGRPQTEGHARPGIRRRAASSLMLFEWTQRCLEHRQGQSCRLSADAQQHVPTPAFALPASWPTLESLRPAHTWNRKRELIRTFRKRC